jgi:hypothetical protein
VTTVFSYFFIDKLSEGRGLAGRGTFRFPGETDEAKQLPYNLAEFYCAPEGEAKEFRCRLTEAVVGASPGAPSCFLDMQFLEFDMKEISHGVLVGGAPDGSGWSTRCFNAVLTINRNTKRVSLSFERTQYPDGYSSLKGGMCGQTSPTPQVLMNCGALVPDYTKKTPAPGERICDFEEH